MDATEQPEGMSFLKDMPIEYQNTRLLRDNIKLFRVNEKLEKKIKSLEYLIRDYKQTLENSRRALTISKTNEEQLKNRLSKVQDTNLNLHAKIELLLIKNERIKENFLSVTLFHFLKQKKNGSNS